MCNENKKNHQPGCIVLMYHHILITNKCTEISSGNLENLKAEKAKANQYDSTCFKAVDFLTNFLHKLCVKNYPKRMISFNFKCLDR